MGKNTRRHLSYANVMATLAVFITLGGASYAAATIVPADSVGTAQLRDGAVTAAKVRNGSLTYNNLSSQARGLLRGPRGAQGVPGPRGLPGPKGDPGNPGPVTNSVELGGTAVPLQPNNLYYMAASGLSTPSTIVPNAEYGPSDGLTASQLFVHVDATPPSGQSWSFALNNGSGDTSIACTIGAGENACWSPQGVSVQFNGPVEMDAYGTSGATPTRVEWGWEATPTY
jgi:hypothetical protein